MRREARAGTLRRMDNTGHPRTDSHGDRAQAPTDLTAACALAAALLLATLCAMTLATGTSQQWFEFVHAPDEYARALASQGRALRAIIAVDDGFIAAYVSATVLFALRLARGRPGALHGLIIAGGVAAGVLDLVENHHILALLRAAERGLPVALDEIVRRSVGSQTKWLLGHVAFVLVGLAMPARSPAARAFRATLLFVQLPLGALCWALDGPAWQPVLQWSRYASFLSGFAMIAWLTRRAPAPARADGVAAATGVPA
jgi:hypothetical protein